MNSYSYATHSDISQKGPSIKYVTLFWTNCDPSLCHTSRDLLKYVTHLGTPIYTCLDLHTCLYRGFVLVRMQGFLSEGFVWVFFVWKVLSGLVLVRSPFCQNTSVT